MDGKYNDFNRFFIDKCYILLYTIYNTCGDDNMNFIISNNGDVPIYEQIKSAIISQITDGTLLENEVLPSVRNMAKDLRISVLTVKKAYDELEEMGFIKTIHGKGSFVASKNLELLKEEQLKKIENHIMEIINIATITNISKEEIIELFHYLYEEDNHE